MDGFANCAQAPSPPRTDAAQKPVTSRIRRPDSRSTPEGFQLKRTGRRSGRALQAANRVAVGRLLHDRGEQAERLRPGVTEFGSELCAEVLF